MRLPTTSLFAEAQKTAENFTSEITIFGSPPETINHAVPGHYSLKQQKSLLENAARLGFHPDPRSVRSDAEWSRSVGHKTRELATRDVVARMVRDIQPDLAEIESKRKQSFIASGYPKGYLLDGY